MSSPQQQPLVNHSPDGAVSGEGQAQQLQQRQQQLQQTQVSFVVAWGAGQPYQQMEAAFQDLLELEECGVGVSCPFAYRP